MIKEETVVDQSHWKDWDKNREVEQGISQPIQAEKAIIYGHYQLFVQLRFDPVVTMVMAVANPYAFQGQPLWMVSPEP